MAKRYRKRPVVIEAVQFTGKNDDEVLAFCAGACYDPEDTEPSIAIDTLEGKMIARPGWWIIKGVRGEFYPVDPVIFNETYEEVVGDVPELSMKTLDLSDPVHRQEFLDALKKYGIPVSDGG